MTGLDCGIMCATPDETWRELSFGMSNLDGTIDDGLDAALRSEAGKVFARHAGWDFNGLVWFADGRFHEEVWCHHVAVDVLVADTLRELMTAVCERYGYE